jgi:phosphoribosylanthranilate isomerase
MSSTAPGGTTATLKIKICGVTTPEDARLAVELGADFLGLNFHPPSPRYLSTRQARTIADTVAGRIPIVGVFVNRPTEEIERITGAVRLDLLQMHGDESPEEVARLGGRALKVFRRDRLPSRRELVLYPDVWGFLFDVPHETLYGGTGRSWSYETVAGFPDLHRRVGGRPVFLAGGVGPDNIRRIRDAAAAAGLLERMTVGVDVCSGVEAAPGVKDRKQMERLFTEIRDGQSPIAS